MYEDEILHRDLIQPYCFCLQNSHSTATLSVKHNITSANNINYTFFSYIIKVYSDSVVSIGVRKLLLSLQNSSNLSLSEHRATLICFT